MKIDIPDDVMQRAGLSDQEIKEIVAVSLYQLEKINGVQGGKIIGKSEIEFHEVVGKYGQTFSYDAEDLLDDIGRRVNEG
ncbi:hypothetical protein BTA51_11395 [Hahella sp. CCB-MM4]|uniref:UPF0175 family protein n=1 Tax=Hahella sp. (strain CCB-MM4) TaxID=1926491 RepID=UPI000B9B868F|nr:UPF0175 family protein [Hahella sp. CCB-MM4]OZG73094.1 hypothetical protein BTA51_11395 [Hahella sp. CCB-MM4]